MKKQLAVIAIAITAVIASSPLANAASKRDQVIGTGTINNAIESRINAQSGAQGEDPKGTIFVDFTDGAAADRRVDVSCMVVAGNTAIVGGLDQTGTETFVPVQDNGKTGDLAGFTTGIQGGPAPDRDRCALVLSSSAIFLPATGNYRVEDA